MAPFTRCLRVLRRQLRGRREVEPRGERREVEPGGGRSEEGKKEKSRHSLSGDSARYNEGDMEPLYNELNNRVGAIDQESVLGYCKRRLCVALHLTSTMTIPCSQHI